MLTAAFWSAVAAIFAAISSFLTMLIHRRNLLESVRPELVLTDWSRSARGNTDTAHDVISFRSIRNIGRGAAVNIIMPGTLSDADLPRASLSSRRIPILAVNETAEISGEIICWWKNVPGRGGHSVVGIAVELLCWDARGMRHQTRYQLAVFDLSENPQLCEELVPGVMLLSRTTTTRAVWWLKLSARIEKVPARAREFVTRTKTLLARIPTFIIRLRPRPESLSSVGEPHSQKPPADSVSDE